MKVFTNIYIEGIEQVGFCVISLIYSAFPDDIMNDFIYVTNAK